MGANTWREAESWPPSDAIRTELFFDNAAGTLTREQPSSAPQRTFAYDPNDPTPMLERLSSGPLPEWSPRDTAFIEQRDDVLVYTSEPVATAMEIAGPVHLVLHVASDAVDTDFAALLANVDLDGT